jgi:hypothetical protein
LAALPIHSQQLYATGFWLGEPVDLAELAEQLEEKKSAYRGLPSLRNPD